MAYNEQDGTKEPAKTESDADILKEAQDYLKECINGRATCAASARTTSKTARGRA